MMSHPLEAGDPTEVAGYRLRARLGAGGMGRVYLAFTPGGRPVAMKVMRPELGEDPEFRARFRQEIEAARRVSGLFTAQVLDGDPDGSPPWLVTTYVPGPSLAQAVAGHGPIPVQSVLVLVAGVAEALQAIHAAGLVHRDLKPSNVLLAQDGPRVIDFGIARAVEAAGLTRTGMRVGSPQFMAPEQIRGEVVSPATDVFALGVLAGYSAMGRSPFGEGEQAAILYRVLHDDPDLAGYPEPLRTLAAGCLVKDAAARPAPAEIIAFCRSRSATGSPEFTQAWLPSTLAADLSRYVAPHAPAMPPTVPRASGAATVNIRTAPYEEADPAKPRRRALRALVATGTVAVVAVAALAGYAILTSAKHGSTGHRADGGSSPRTSDTRTPAALDSCLFGTWTGNVMDFPLTLDGQRIMFTGYGPGIVFYPDGTSVIHYDKGTKFTSDLNIEVTLAGDITYHYTTRNGNLLVSNASSDVSYAVLTNGPNNSSGPEPLPHSWSDRYTCSATTLQLSTNGQQATLTRHGRP